MHMKVYSVLAGLLLAIPESKRFLVAGARRMVVERKPCGCLFGTVIPKVVRDDVPGGRGRRFSTYAFCNISTPFDNWCREELGLVKEHYPIFAALESLNDAFKPGQNDLHTCRERYNFVLDNLTRRADQEESAVDRPTPAC